MAKRLISVLGACALFAGLAASAAAQQLYVTNIQTRFNVGATDDAFCQNGIDGYDVSFATYNYATGAASDPSIWSSKIEWEQPRLSGGQNVYPGNCLKLCATIQCVVASTPTTFGIDDLTFEVFKYASGSNPLDTSSTPPLKTISMYNIGQCNCPNETACPNYKVTVGTYCANWDGSYNLNGLFGKTNGQFGFRAKVTTNQVSETAGNISITQTAAYPGANQMPITVDVVNVHVVRSSPTVVGKITGVAAQPYNILYRLSKGASTTIKLFDATDATFSAPVRTLINDTPRVGEGTPDGTLTNGDYWDGRDDTGAMLPSGNYVAFINAKSYDYFGLDNAYGATVYMELDPLQVTDVALKPLGASATDVATISYMLTEAATVYVNIYSPGATFTNVNAAPPTLASGTLLRSFVEQKDRRVTTATYWDGRDNAGNPVCDGDYVYAIYAAMPSVRASGGTIYTSKSYVGTIPVARGNVVAFMTPSSTVLGSSPSVAGLQPFYFRYTPTRDTYVTLNIRDMNNNIVRRVTNNEVRFSNFSNREIWDGKTDTGYYASSGSYLAELVTTDPYQCSALKTSTMTVQFPVDMFRTVDVLTKSLMGGTSDVATVSFELSETMYMDLNIYPVSTVINPSVWPPVVGVSPIYGAHGVRPGRYKVTEYWDGRDSSGLLVEDGRYPFTLVVYSTGTSQRMYSTDDTYGYIDVARGQIIFTSFDVIPSIPTMYNSSDTVKLPPYEIDYSLTRQSSVTVQILTLESPARVVANVTSGGVRDGDMVYQDFWDGKDDAGNFVEGGAYNVRVTAQDIATNLSARTTVQQTIDVYPLRIFDVSIVPLTMDNMAAVSYQVSEPMKVVTKIYRPGTSFDSAGNVYPVGDTTLVKRIIGVRPARTQISEYWDGTDLTLSKVPDGNYVFKIYASTMTESISTLDGSIGTGAVLADDIVTSNIPVTKSGTADLCGDFSHDSFFAPNPYSGLSGWFKIPAVINGTITLKIYNLAGDLVYKKDYGERGAGDDIDGTGHCSAAHTHEACWPKVNTYGGTVAPGVYFAVLRFEATAGTRDVCQTVKKILIP